MIILTVFFGKFSRGFEYLRTSNSRADWRKVTLQEIELWKGFKKYVFLSTCCGYGGKGGGLVDVDNQKGGGGPANVEKI